MKKTFKKNTSIKKRKSVKRTSVKGGGRSVKKGKRTPVKGTSVNVGTKIKSPPPDLDTIKKFKEYVNTKLEAEYSTTPSDALDVLKKVLEEFIGTRSDFLRGKILEFTLNLKPAVEFTYEFTKDWQEGDYFNRSRKYFQYRFYDAPTVQRVIEINDDEDSD
jgi:hypothetical protein